MKMYRWLPGCPAYSLFVLLFLMLIHMPGSAQDAITEVDDKTLITALRAGGFNIYFRHERTDWTQSDDIRQRDDWLSCDGQHVRQLSIEGRQRAMHTGNAIRALGIPVGKVLASPYCRTMDTARLMKLGAVTPTTEVINMRIAQYFGGSEAIIASARSLLSRQPESGKNTIIVAHGNVAQSATPVYPDEGEGVIFRPLGDSQFEFFARIKTEDWKRLQHTFSE